MQVKKDEIRNRILETAQRLFIKRGYENTSLKQIAEKSNISKSNIYRYYRSKDEIYENLAGSAREAVIKASYHFFTPEFIGKYTPDKCDEISAVLARLFSEHHSGILIMLRSSVGKDRKLLEELIINRFIEACPIKDEDIKKLISRIMLFGFTDILLEHSDEKSISAGLRAMICYHYLGLNGLKEKYGINT